MIDSTSQWLFLVANTKGSKSNTSSLISYVREGGNVAIATNTSVMDGVCERTNDCLYYELFRDFCWSLSKVVREEEAMYGQLSDEEWEAIRLTKRERRDSMLEYIKVSLFIILSRRKTSGIVFFSSRQRFLLETPTCTGCIRWKFEAAETWGLRFADMIGNKLKAFKAKVTEAAYWVPTNGLVASDAIFPHIAHGFRNRQMPIAIFHVSWTVEAIANYDSSFWPISRIRRGKFWRTVKRERWPK